MKLGRIEIVMNKFLILILCVVALAGCAVNTRYVPYTGQHFAPKDRYNFINVYPEARPLPFQTPYTVIGRVEASGEVGSGVNADTLQDVARNIARSKGADAIINARTESASYGGVAVIPARCGRRYCRPAEYVPYHDVLLHFRGELIVFSGERQ